MIRPSTSPITMHFGSTDPPYSAASPHKGTDFAYIPDDKVYAPFSGKVTCKPLNGDDGNAIYMWQGDYFIGLCHLLHFLVVNGQDVVAGQVVGIMGDTGKAEGRHLHFAVQYKNEYIDPESVIGKEDTIMEPQDYRVNWGDVQNAKAALGLPINDGDKGFVGMSFKEFYTELLIKGAEWANHKASLETDSSQKLADIKKILGV